MGSPERWIMEEFLQHYFSIDRKDLVRRAHAVGITKHRIHVLTGIARPTIDRWLAAK